MEIKWFTPALDDLKHIYNRSLINFGILSANKISDQIHATISQLGIFPGLGPIEPLLNHRPEPWRSLVIHRNIKVIYLICSKSVNIAALWDTRREPKSLAKYIDHVVQTEPTVLNEPSIPYIQTDK